MATFTDRQLEEAALATRERAAARRRAAAAMNDDLAEKLIATDKAATKAAVPPPPEPVEAPPIIVTSAFSGRLLVLVVGAGGTGARVVPPLTQMLRRNDCVAVIDHDIVEDRNLLRQHFSRRDIGAAKAAVLADRYRKDGVHTAGFQVKLDPSTNSQVFASIVQAFQTGPQVAIPFTGVVVIGCVDNAAARRAILHMLTMPSAHSIRQVAWIDVGNEMRGGQVLLTFHHWLCKTGGRVRHPEPVWLTLDGLRTAMPQLLRDRPEDDEALSCGERIDLQTVQVNHMASSMAVNVLSWLTLGIPFTSAGMFFSTLNTVQPIKIANLVGANLVPDASHAIAG